MIWENVNMQMRTYNTFFRIGVELMYSIGSPIILIPSIKITIGHELFLIKSYQFKSLHKVLEHCGVQIAYKLYA